jgi:hypothetical protein
VVAALCRLLARQGVKAVPFKPQNMALNSAVTSDGGEIGRAQALQAQTGKPFLAVLPYLHGLFLDAEDVIQSSQTNLTFPDCANKALTVSPMLRSRC